jgi:hypothetical protein
VSARAARTLLAALLLVAALPLGAAAGVGAGASATQVWTENIFGTEPSPSDGITDGRGWLAWTPSPAWRFAANGRRLNFRDNPDLNHGYLTLSAEAIPSAPNARTRVQSGVSGAWRLNADLYAPFDYRDALAYVSAKHYLTPSFTAQLRADLSARTYPDQSAEDARKAWLTARVQRSLPTRTSVTMALRTGWKTYVDDARSNAGARELNVQLAQSISTRLALRSWWSNSHLFQHGDAAAQMAAFDNPLMDEFSFDGNRVGMSLKVIAPLNLAFELSGERAWLDYPGRPPALYDPVTDKFLLNGTLLALGEGERSDSVTRLRLQVERRGARLWGDTRVDLDAALEWNDQSSNDLYWQWSGLAGQVGMSLQF